MLNKKICQFCLGEKSWNKFSENAWYGREREQIDEGCVLPHVHCVTEKVGIKRAYVNEHPPEWCSYALEHALENQDVQQRNLPTMYDKVF